MELNVILETMKQKIDNWAEEISNKDADQIVKRTSLQVGIHDSALLEYNKGEVSVGDSDLNFAYPENNNNNNNSKSYPGEALTEIQVAQIVPELASYMRQKINELPSALLNFQFTLEGKFRAQERAVNVRILEYVDETRKQQLLEQISKYIAVKIEAGKYPTKPLETFFLSRHLLDERLFPQLEVIQILTIWEKIQDLNKGNKHLAEHRGYLVQALRNWVEDHWLPRYFDNIGTQWQKKYKKKSDAQLESSEQGLVELVIYAATLILKYEPSYSRSTGLDMLNCLIELGSERAKRIMKDGSGTFLREDVTLNDEFVQCTANDVFAEVSIVIKQETEESYGRALKFLIRLLGVGFHKSYKIKLKSSTKNWLQVKGVAKSGTHRFFANAMEYPNLHLLLEQYARAAMEPFEWYADTEGEKNCMPGSYAVFGLGLADQTYFPLVEDYMEMVDEEHQSVQNHFTVALAEHHGVNAQTIPTLVKCMLHSTDSMKLKIKEDMEEEEHLRLLLDQVRGLQVYVVEHIVYLIWGGTDKLRKLAAKTEGNRGKWLSELVQAVSRG